jgi:hypothetical protein
MVLFLFTCSHKFHAKSHISSQLLSLRILLLQDLSVDGYQFFHSNCESHPIASHQVTPEIQLYKLPPICWKVQFLGVDSIFLAIVIHSLFVIRWAQMLLHAVIASSWVKPAIEYQGFEVIHHL